MNFTTKTIKCWDIQNPLNACECKYLYNEVPQQEPER